MSKYRPIKEKSKSSSNQEGDDRFLYFSPISIILVFVGLAGEAYITVKYWGIDPYANYSLMLLILGIVALSFLFIVNPDIFTKYQTKNLKEENVIFFGLGILMTIAAVTIVWAVLRITIRFALTTEDLYFYYISTAIIEELVFRMAIFGIIRSKVKFGTIIGIPISALVFMMAHYEYYGQNYVNMIAVLLSGVVFAIVYVIFDDISVSKAAHVIINIIAVGNILILV